MACGDDALNCPIEGHRVAEVNDIVFVTLLATGFAVGFLQAFGVEVKSGTRFDLKSAEGKEIDVFVSNGEYQGRLVNRVEHKYRACREDVKAVA